VARKEGDRWLVLHADDQGYGIREGTAFRWHDTMCCQMVAGNGPRIAPCTAMVPAYARAPIGRQVPIGAYVGVPLWGADGALFGTLCAIHPEPLPETIQAQQRPLELLASSFNDILSTHLSHGDGEQAVEAKATFDSLTGAYDDRGWRQQLIQHERACQQYGHATCAIAIDIDGLHGINEARGEAAGDAAIRTAARTIRGAIFQRDPLARVDGDEFAVLGIQCDPQSARVMKARLEAALAAAEVPASVGMAQRDPALGLKQAWNDAYLAMHRAKKQRKQGHQNGARAAFGEWN